MVVHSHFLATSLLILSSALAAQTAPSSVGVSKPVRANAETLVVLGSATPVPLAESSRPVLLLPVGAQQLTAASPLDLLRADSSLFLEQRGSGGGSTDLVLRGGSASQTLVLINGFRINDSQTGHHTLDLPFPLEALDSIQILPGAGSTLHGTDALSGVVDFLTAAPNHASVRLRAAGGSFSSNEESLLAGAIRGPVSARLTAGRNFSEGFRVDRDYRNEDASSELWLGSVLGLTDLMLASSDRAFGADQFYGDYNSWERTKGWFTAVRQELGSHTTAAFADRRHTDQFLLYRTNPAAYENNHITRAWQSSLRRAVPLAGASMLLLGLESDGDSIESSSLGRHARNRGAGYVDFDLHPASRRWTFSTGLRQEILSGGARAFSPQLSAGFRATPALRLRAAVGHGFRIPTYTDLYYSDPATSGNSRLKPESAWSFDAGLDGSFSAHLALSATGFYSRQHDAIDYLRASSASKWQAENLSGLRFAGLETAITWSPTHTEVLRFSWTALHGAQSALHGFESRYVSNYPVENLHASWTSLLPHAVVLANSLQLAQRSGQRLYPLWNATLARDAGRLRPFLRLNNLSGTGYQEIAGVPMPGRSITGGIALQFGR